MERSGHRKGLGRLVVECTEPEDSALLTELEAGIEDEVRDFRAEIVGRWAREYAERRNSGDQSDPNAAAADLRAWSQAYFQAAAEAGDAPDGDGPDDDGTDGDDDATEIPLADDECAA